MQYMIVISVVLVFLSSVDSSKRSFPTKVPINIRPEKLTLSLTSATRSQQSLSLKAALRVKPQNPKPCPCFVPAVYSPICGSDNKAYANKYLLECENTCSDKKLHVLHDGKC